MWVNTRKQAMKIQSQSTTVINFSIIYIYIKDKTFLILNFTEYKAQETLKVYNQNSNDEWGVWLEWKWRC